MDHEELVATFGLSVGVEKAESLVAHALADVGIDPAESYSTHEIADVCETIARSSDGYVRVVANEIRVREQARRRFDAFLEEISDPVVTVSFDETEPVVDAINPAFEETFGFTPETARGVPLEQLIVPANEAGSDVDEWLRTETGDAREVRRELADGEVRTFLFRTVVVTGFDGSIEGYGIYTDITERERRERRLELQNEQLERFASVVSHDLRNPMMVASGNLELALELAEGEVREYLGRVADAHDRMEQLIDDLLALASQGTTVDDPVRVDLTETILKAWRNVETADAALAVTVPEDCSILAHEGRLCQLFENLFRNAVEHGVVRPGASTVPDEAIGEREEDAVGERAEDAAGGRAEDAVERRAENADEESCESPRDRDDRTRSLLAVLEDPPVARIPQDPAVAIHVGWTGTGVFVEDDGPGIPPEDRERIFEHGVSTTSEGTGFGLAIAQAIAEAHGWTIAATDGAVGGARFDVEGIQSAERS